MNHLTIENRKGKLKLNDGVYKESADKLIEELEQLYGPAAVLAQMKIGDVVCAADEALESVEVEINSPGGSVFEGHRIYNSLRGMSARGVEIVTTVNGLAASMGSVILMAGDKRQMTNGSRIMIHEASCIAWGDSRVMRKNAELLEGISSEIAGIYADRTGGNADSIRQLMHAETWMTADEAKENGFVHAVLKDGKAKAEFDTPEKGMSIFARIFPNNEEAVSKLENMLSENETLRADLESAQAKVTELTALSEANAQLQSDLTETQSKLEAAERLVAENAQAIADLTEKATLTEEKVSLAAAEMLAATGHPAPVELVEANPDKPQDIIAQYEALEGPEKWAFLAKNSQELLAAARKQSAK